MKPSRPLNLALIVALALLQLLLSGALSACARPVAGAGAEVAPATAARHGRHGGHDHAAHHAAPPAGDERAPAPGGLADCPLMIACAAPATVPDAATVAAEVAPPSPPVAFSQAEPASPDLDPDTPPPRG